MRGAVRPGRKLLRAGDKCVSPSWPTRCAGSAAEGRAFYAGDIAAAISSWVTERGGLLTDADLRAYEVVDREPIRVGYRGREVLTNPPPSAGGILIARALAMLGAQPGPPTVEQVVAVMERTQRERTPEFLEGLGDPAYVLEFLRGTGGRLGSTTHVAALDCDGGRAR